jgi:outer membrane protein assembly factor BamB
MADQKRESPGKRPRSMVLRRVRASTVLAAAWLALTVLVLTACGAVRRARPRAGLTVATYDPRRLYLLDLRTGRLRWQDTLTEPPAGQQQILQAGRLAVLQGDPATPGHPAALLAYQLTSGRPAWRVDLPTFVVTQPVLTPGRILVQPADLMSDCAAVG